MALTSWLMLAEGVPVEPRSGARPAPVPLTEWHCAQPFLSKNRRAPLPGSPPMKIDQRFWPLWREMSPPARSTEVLTAITGRLSQGRTFRPSGDASRSARGLHRGLHRGDDGLQNEAPAMKWEAERKS